MTFVNEHGDGLHLRQRPERWAVVSMWSNRLWNTECSARKMSVIFHGSRFNWIILIKIHRPLFFDQPDFAILSWLKRLPGLQPCPDVHIFVG